jgi:TatA/E family protein of Tat protein translocase
MFTSIGTPEILVIFLVALLLFGADKLPELARGVGKGMSEFRKASDNLKNELEKSKNDIQNTYQSTFEDEWAVDMDMDMNGMDEDSEGRASIDEDIQQNGETTNNYNDNDNSN